MKKDILLLFVCSLLYVQSARDDSEIVWLKDVTTSFETEKRTSIDLDLPDELTFHLSRGSNDLTLHLKRNYFIDPNADVYVVKKLKNGKRHLQKAENLGKEDHAYYVDRRHGAFMTVRCVRKSNGQCDRVINGNIRIGERNYDLRQAEIDITSRNVFDVSDFLGTLYVLRDQANTPRDISTEINTDAVNVDMEKVKIDIVDRLARSARGQDKHGHFQLVKSTFSTRNAEGFHNRRLLGIRNNGTYWIEITVLLDSSVWDLFVSLAKSHQYKVADVTRRVREYYSHIINGVHMSYKEIEDSSLDVSITLRAFYILKDIRDIAFRGVHVVRKNGKTYIDAERYLHDISDWDEKFGYDTHHDHTMLFTRHDLFEESVDNNDIKGLSNMFGICIAGRRISVVQGSDYFETVRTAAHELGHNIGADDDGDGRSTDCPAGDLFIMDPDIPPFDPGQSYSKNPWMFSNCSVRIFKKALRITDCLTNPGIFFNKEEWKNYTMKLPEELYTPNEQCQFINGPTSEFCEAVSENICLHMKCKDPKTGKCNPTPVTAHRGTRCGENKWCMKGKCVLKTSK